MNDFERKLRETPLRRPPEGWCEEILSGVPAREPAIETWREWLWPPPIAWAALAAVWVILLTVEFITGGMPARQIRRGTFEIPAPQSLLSLRNDQALALLR